LQKFLYCNAKQAGFAKRNIVNQFELTFFYKMKSGIVIFAVTIFGSY